MTGVQTCALLILHCSTMPKIILIFYSRKFFSLSFFVSHTFLSFSLFSITLLVRLRCKVQKPDVVDFGPSSPLSSCKLLMLRATRANLSVMMPLDSVTMNNAVNRRKVMNVSLPELKWRVWCQKASPKWVAIQFFWVFFFFFFMTDG